PRADSYSRARKLARFHPKTPSVGMRPTSGLKSCLGDAARGFSARRQNPPKRIRRGAVRNFGGASEPQFLPDVMTREYPRLTRTGLSNTPSTLFPLFSPSLTTKEWERDGERAVRFSKARRPNLHHD